MRRVNLKGGNAGTGFFSEVETGFEIAIPGAQPKDGFAFGGRFAKPGFAVIIPAPLECNFKWRAGDISGELFVSRP